MHTVTLTADTGRNDRPDSQMLADSSPILTLATFGEAFQAYTALRSDCGRRRRQGVETEMFPWGDAISNQTAESALAANPKAAAAPQREKSSPAKPRRVAGRCQCAKCPTCKDNSRWERIFEEKFADSQYYQKTHIRHSSPLSSL